MAVINLPDGRRVEFDGTPSEGDVREVYNLMGFADPEPSLLKQATSFFPEVAVPGVKGFGKSLIGGAIGATQLLTTAGRYGVAALDPFRTYEDLAYGTEGARRLTPGTEESEALKKRFRTDWDTAPLAEKAGSVAGMFTPYFAGGGKVFQATEKLPFFTRLGTRVGFELGLDSAYATFANQSMTEAGTEIAAVTPANIAGNLIDTLLPTGRFTPLLTGLTSGYTADVSMGMFGLRGEDREGLNSFIPGMGTLAGATLGTAGSIANKPGPIPETIERTVRQRANVLSNIESSNSRVRTAFSEARQKGVDPISVISSSDILNGAVDRNGTINLEDAIENFRTITKPYDAKVHNSLIEEGSFITRQDIQRRFADKYVSSNLQGDLRIRLRNAIEREVEGLMDVSTNGRIPLVAVHDSKVQKMNSINYANPKSKVVDKEVARILKEIVEEGSQSLDVKAYNEELGRLYTIRNAVIALDGRKVEGGRLGKHFSTVVGAIAGSSQGPIGALMGAEAGGAIRGALMQRSMGRDIPATDMTGGVRGALNQPPPGIQDVDMRTSPRGGFVIEPLDMRRQTETPVRSEEVPETTGTRLWDAIKDRIRWARENANDQRGFIANPFAKANPEADNRTVRAFDESTDQRRITTKWGSDFVVGTFGNNSFLNKLTQRDRTSFNELKDVIDNAVVVIRGTMNENNPWRYFNKVFIAPDGEGHKVVYTRRNRFGDEEIINAHGIPKGNMKQYLKDIGISSRTRTGMPGVEDPQFVQLTYGDNLSIPQQIDRINESMPGVPPKRRLTSEGKSLQERVNRLKRGEALYITDQKRFETNDMDVGGIGDVSPETRQAILSVLRGGGEVKLSPEVQMAVRDDLVQAFSKKADTMVEKAPDAIKLPKDILQVGLSPVKGKKRTQWDDMVTAADAAFEAGNTAEADRIYQDIIKGAQDRVKARFEGTGIGLVFNDRAGFGVYKGTPEPNIDFYAKVAPNSRDEEVFNQVVREIAEKDFFQDSVVTYRPRDVVYKDLDNIQPGVVDPERGISIEPGISFALANPLSLDDLKTVNKLLSDAGLEAFSLKQGGQQIDIFNITAYNNDYGQFIQQIKSFAENLNNAGFSGGPQFRVQEVRFAGGRGSGATTSYSRAGRAFAESNKEFLQKTRYFSNLLTRLRFRESISKAEIRKMVKEPGVPKAEAEAILFALTKTDKQSITPKELESLVWNNSLRLGRTYQSEHYTYRFNELYPASEWMGTRDPGPIKLDGEQIVGRSMIFRGLKEKWTEIVKHNHFYGQGYFGHVRAALRNLKGKRHAFLLEGQADLAQHRENVTSVLAELDSGSVNVERLRSDVLQLQAVIREKEIEIESLENGTSFTHKGVEELTLVMNSMEEAANRRGVELTDVTLATIGKDGDTITAKLVFSRFDDDTNASIDVGTETITLTSPYNDPTSLGSGQNTVNQSYESLKNVKENALEQVDTYIARFKRSVENWKEELAEANSKIENAVDQRTRTYNKVIAEQVKAFGNSNSKTRDRVWQEGIEGYIKEEKPDYIAVPMPSTASVIEGFASYDGPRRGASGLQLDPDRFPATPEPGAKVYADDGTELYIKEVLEDNRISVYKPPTDYVDKSTYFNYDTVTKEEIAFDSTIEDAYFKALKERVGDERMTELSNANGRTLTKKDGRWQFARKKKAKAMDWFNLLGDLYYASSEDKYFDVLRNLVPLDSNLDEQVTWVQFVDKYMTADVREISEWKLDEVFRGKAAHDLNIPLSDVRGVGGSQFGFDAEMFFAATGTFLKPKTAQIPTSQSEIVLDIYDIDMRSGDYERMSDGQRQVLENYFYLVEDFIPRYEQQTGMKFQPFKDDYGYRWLRAKAPKRFPEQPKTQF